MDNVVEGLQTEMDGANRVLVERCVFRRSVKSPGLGFLSGNFGTDKSGQGFHNTHITVRRNYFSNSDNLSMGMVTFQLDPSTNCGTRFQDVDIVDNVFVYDIDSTTGHCAIKLGTGDSGAARRRRAMSLNVFASRATVSTAAHGKAQRILQGVHLVQLLGRRGPAESDRCPWKPSLRGRPDAAAGANSTGQPKP